MTRRTALTLGVGATIHIADGNTKEHPRVRLLRVPNSGLQPQVAGDSEGVLHLLYYSGDPFQGNVFYFAEGPRGVASSRETGGAVFWKSPHARPFAPRSCS